MTDDMMNTIQRYAEAMVQAATLRQELERMGALSCPVAEAIMPEVRERAFSDDVCTCDHLKAPDHLTITLTGPQGCGKTAMADWLRLNINHMQGLEGIASSMRAEVRDYACIAVKDRKVSIIDTSKD